MELYEIQAPNHTAGKNLSDTEVARTIAANSGWQFNGAGEIYADDGIVAASLDEATTAIVGLGWICEFPHGSTKTRQAEWKAIPDEVENRAEAIRNRIATSKP